MTGALASVLSVRLFGSVLDNARICLRYVVPAI